MNLPQIYNQDFIAYANKHGKVYNDAAGYGVTITAVPDPTKLHWRVIGVHHLTGPENHGQHNVFVDVLDEQGKRIEQTRLDIFQADGTSRGYMVIDKPPNEPGSNTPMHWNDTLTVIVNRDGLPSEKANGMHTRHPDEGPGTTRGHHSFYVVWQRRRAGGPVTPPVPEIPPPDPVTPPGTATPPGVGFTETIVLFEDARLKVSLVIEVYGGDSG